MAQPSFAAVHFRSNHAADSAVLADLLRAYGFQPEEGYDAAAARNAEPCAGAGDNAPATNLSLEITWSPGFTGVTAVWTAQDQTWTRQETVQPSAYEETEESRRRRVLRLAVHHLIAGESALREAIQAPYNPWGILTGVRPTKMLQRFYDQGLGDEEITPLLERDFGIEESRVRMLIDVCRSQRRFLPEVNEGRDKVSLYLCYPFCPSRCSYCSFPGYDLHRWKKWQEPYLQALEQEIRQVGKACTDGNFQVDTLYFGGGTPTSMPPASMDRILDALQESFLLSPRAEWTVEGGRPETLTQDMLDILTAHPVNRICVNPQSMNQNTLDRIGRLHAAEETERAIVRVRESMEKSGRTDWRLNCDLILGLPGEGLGEVRESFARVMALKPDNVTVHGLAVKRGSVYREQAEKLPDRRIGMEMIELSRGMLAEAGYSPYYLYRQKDSLAGGENVGYTLPGCECLYNIMMIEERQTILGLGAGSGSKFLRAGSWELENFYNPKDMIQYIERAAEYTAKKTGKLVKDRLQVS